MTFGCGGIIQLFTHAVNLIENSPIGIRKYRVNPLERFPHKVVSRVLFLLVKFRLKCASKHVMCPLRIIKFAPLSKSIK